LAYALGRGIEYTDLPAIRKIARDSASQDYRWSGIILGIVRSTPFSMSSVAAPLSSSYRAATARESVLPQAAATVGKGTKVQHDRL
jgi:hypothetical protein